MGRAGSSTIRFTALVTDNIAFTGQTITNTAYFSSTNAGFGSSSARFPSLRIYLPLVMKN